MVLEYAPVLNSELYDVYLLLFNDKYKKAWYVSAQKITQQNFFWTNPVLIPNGLLREPDSQIVYFAGQSPGYATKNQQEGGSKLKSFVYKVDFQKQQECLHTDKITESKVGAFTSHYQRWSPMDDEVNFRK